MMSGGLTLDEIRPLSASPDDRASIIPEA